MKRRKRKDKNITASGEAIAKRHGTNVKKNIIYGDSDLLCKN